MLSVISDDELKNWYYWQKGMEKWKAVLSDPVIIAGIENCRSNQSTNNESPATDLPDQIEDISSADLSDDATQAVQKNVWAHEQVEANLQQFSEETPTNSQKKEGVVEIQSFESRSQDESSDSSQAVVNVNPADQIVDITNAPTQLVKNEVQASSYNPTEDATEIVPAAPLYREDTLAANTQLLASDEKEKELEPIDILQQTRTIPPEFLAQSVTTSVDKLKSSGGSERRKTNRFNLNFRLMISNGEDSIITFSSDISLGGIRLAHELPTDFVGKECEIYIMNNETRESIQLACRGLGTGTNRIRIAFAEHDLDTLEKLLCWMVEGKMKKTVAG